MYEALACITSPARERRQTIDQLSMLLYSCHPRTQEAEAGGSLYASPGYISKFQASLNYRDPASKSKQKQSPLLMKPREGADLAAHFKGKLRAQR